MKKGAGGTQKPRSGDIHADGNSAMLPPPPPFAHSACHSSTPRGKVRRRRFHCYHLSDKNTVDLRLLDRESNTNGVTDSGIATSGSSSAIDVENGACGDSLRHSSCHHHSSHCSFSVPLPSHGGEPLAEQRASVPLFSSRGCDPPSKILDFLFIGGVSDATNAEFLRRENIVTILNVSREEYWSVDRNTVIHPFPVDDTSDANIQQFFCTTHSLLERSRRAYYRAVQSGGSVAAPRVLVHCQRGRSRSVTIVLAYLIRRNGWTVAEALQYVACRRRCAEPNIGFIDALRTHQESMDTEERTRRRSSLCLAVRNLSRGVASSSVHLFFEDRVGCVQGVMVHSSRVSKSEHGGGGGDGDGGGGDDGGTLCLVFFAAAECVRMAKKLFNERPALFDALDVAGGRTLQLTIPSKLIGPARAASATREEEDADDTPRGHSAVS